MVKVNFSYCYKLLKFFELTIFNNKITNKKHLCYKILFKQSSSKQCSKKHLYQSLPNNF